MSEVFRSMTGEALIASLGPQDLILKAEISPDHYENARQDELAYTTLVVLAPKDPKKELTAQERNDLAQSLMTTLPPHAANPQSHQASDRGAIFFGEVYITDRLLVVDKRMTAKTETTAVHAFDEDALRRLHRTIPTVGVEHDIDIPTRGFDTGKIRVVMAPSQRKADAFIKAQQLYDSLPEDLVDPARDWTDPKWHDAREIAKRMSTDLALGFIFPELMPAFQVPPEDPESIENLIANALKNEVINKQRRLQG